MAEEALEKILIGNLTRVNDWLRFAETKNAALLTFSSAWLVAICSLLSNEKVPCSVKISLSVACPFLLGGALIAVASLLPKFQKKDQGETAQQLTTKNLLFHGNISKLDLATAAHAFSTRYQISANGDCSPSHITDLSTQLVETSRVAERKFKLFTAGVYALLIAFVAATLTAAFQYVAG